MKKFSILISRAILIEAENVDTDQIIPARFLKTTKKEGLGKYLFYNWRYDEKGNKKINIFNQTSTKKKKILTGGKNFGTGSSREHAVWSLTDFGFKAVIAQSFGDIFYNNSLKNGLLCIKLNERELKKIHNEVKINQEIELNIDLENQTVSIEELKSIFKFDIDPFRKSRLLLGVDELGYILSHEEKIREYEKKNYKK